MEKGLAADWSDGMKPEMLLVLSSLSEMLISGEFRTGNDAGSLDNAILNAIPILAHVTSWFGPVLEGL